MSGAKPTGARRVVVAEDDKDLRTVLRLALEWAGYQVIAVRTGHEAVAACAAESPDLLVVDLTLPDADGLSVCREVKAQTGLPVLLMTGHGQEYADLARAAGADEFLTKPFRPEDLNERVELLLKDPV